MKNLFEIAPHQISRVSLATLKTERNSTGRSSHSDDAAHLQQVNTSLLDLTWFLMTTPKTIEKCYNVSVMEHRTHAVCGADDHIKKSITS